MADTGFLGGLLAGPDPRAVLQQQRQQAFRPGSREAQNAAFGAQSAGLIGGLGAGVAGLVTGNNDGRSFKGFLQNAGKAAQNIEDSQMAAATGVDVNTLRSNRRIKAELSKRDFGDLSEIENRIKAAEFVAEQAKNDGNMQAFTEAMTQLGALRAEQREFARLESQENRAERKSIFDDVQDIYLNGSTKPITAQRRIEADGTVVYDYVKDGQTLTARPGEFSLEDPVRKTSGSENESIDQRFRKITSSAERAEIRQSIATAASALPRFRRVMENVGDLAEKGGSDIVLSDSGRVVSFIDKGVRNIKGFGSAILSLGNSKENTTTRNSVLARAQDINDSIWDIDLSEDFKRAAASNDQFRAQIMELAYLAARMSEPSNRGLSDNDVQNALQRLTANSANPQTIMRRFVEMLADGAMDVEKRLGTVTQIFGPEHVDDVEQMLGGSTLPKYRADLQSLYTDFDLTLDPITNRATFATPLDADVAPGTGVPAETATEAQETDDDPVGFFLSEG